MPVPTIPTVTSIEVRGATLHAERRGAGPLVVLHAAPMDADAFAPLADLLAGEFTVVTCDPRGINRSRVADPDADVSPDERADDLAALIAHAGAGPAVVFGSSGGAVSALAALQRHPDLISAVIAHEPPLAVLLDDRDDQRRRTEAMVAQYLTGDRVGAWRAFLDLADIDMPPEVFDHVFATPPTGQAAADERFSFEHMELATTFWSPDLDTLRARRDRVIVGVGDESAGQFCDRTARALATALDLTVTAFPGDHIGFVEHADAFAARLRTLVRERARP